MVTPFLSQSMCVTTGKSLFFSLFCFFIQLLLRLSNFRLQVYARQKENKKENCRFVKLSLEINKDSTVLMKPRQASC